MHLTARVKAIMLRPHSEWPIIASEPSDPTDLFTHYVAVLALIPAIAGFVGTSIVGIADPAGGTTRLSLLSGLFSGIFGYLLTFVVVYLLALLINALTPLFGGRRDSENALKLAAYTFTPYWLAGVFLLVPGLRFLTIVGIYGAYLAVRGVGPTMRVPRSRTFVFAVAIAACAIALALLVGGIQATVFSARRAL